MLARQQHDALTVRRDPEHRLVAVRLAEVLKDVLPRAPGLGRGGLERAGRCRIEIGGNQSVDAARNGAPGSDIFTLCGHAIERCRILSHESFSPRGVG